MTIETLQSLVQCTIDQSVKYKNKFGEVGRSIRSLLIKDHAKFVKEVKEQSKIFYTEEIKNENMTWENLLKEIKQIIAFCIKTNNENKQIAAHNLDFFLTRYSFSDCVVLYPQKHIALAMFKIYHEDEELQNSARLIGIDKLFSELERVNLNFTNLQNVRIDEVNEQLNESVDYERSAVVNSYELFCTYVEETASISSNAELHSLFTDMDDLRRRWKTLIPDTGKMVNA